MNNSVFKMKIIEAQDKSRTHLAEIKNFNLYYIFYNLEFL